MKVDGPAVDVGLCGTELTIGLQVQHVLGGCRWPFRHPSAILGPCDEDVDRVRPTPATGSGEMFCQPVKSFVHDDSGALGHNLDMGPRADSQAYIDAAVRRRSYCSII